MIEDMDNTIVVTAGDAFTDIDVLACAVGYRELLQREGQKAETVLPGSMNSSIPPLIHEWNFEFITEPTEPDFNAVIVDLSDPDYISTFIDQKRILEIYDHHFGFEEYWKEKLNDNAHIEMLGACATLIWEEYKRRNFTQAVSTISANLLATAIISNTLNFQSPLTDTRDRQAYEELKDHTTLPDDWVSKYFKDQQDYINQDIYQAILNDTKIKQFKNLGVTLITGQIELWESKKFIQENLDTIQKALESFSQPHWFLSSPSISEGKNYIFTRNDQIKSLLEETIDAKFEGDIGVTKRLWLRKEIHKKLLEKENSV